MEVVSYQTHIFRSACIFESLVLPLKNFKLLSYLTTKLASIMYSVHLYRLCGLLYLHNSILCLNLHYVKRKFNLGIFVEI